MLSQFFSYEKVKYHVCLLKLFIREEKFEELRQMPSTGRYDLSDDTRCLATARGRSQLALMCRNSHDSRRIRLAKSNCRRICSVKFWMHHPLDPLNLKSRVRSLACIP